MICTAVKILKGFERLFIRYKGEAYPKGENIQTFCHRNNVPYNLFEKWYKDTRHKVVEVNVSDRPSQAETGKPKEEGQQKEGPATEVRILMDLRVSNGLHLRQGNLSYGQLTYEIVVYRDKDGNVMCGYFPMDSEKDEPIIESVPGTHASPDLMAYLVFNRFFLDTPVYRETARLLQERMRLSRQTVTNWLEKGSQFFKGVIEYLKDQCLEKDSVVNCDETWCRVKAGGKYRKKYVWCLVNRLARVAVYYYEDGSRGRKVLKDILEGRELRALQTDGYNVYLYLDNEMLDIDHVWNQVFLDRKDGDYTIDNSLAERCIRPLANERKNSLFFGSDKMARVSAAYHSVVSTCKLQGYSILEYLKKFFAEITAGNRDYGKLMPSTIGISANKL